MTLGLRVDTNTATIARTLAPLGFTVGEAVSVADDLEALAATIARLTAQNELVVVTGGLGPTHDDITREAASRALGLDLVEDPRMFRLLQKVRSRHKDPAAAAQILRQAETLAGAEIIEPTTGTAPGQVVATGNGLLALLPGPPSEMLPMLEGVLEQFEPVSARPLELGVVGMTESDAQVTVQRALRDRGGVGFTVLARPGDVRVILSDEGAGATEVKCAAGAAANELGDSCYSTDGATLAETLIREAEDRGVTVALAESCTGGLACAALTDVAGASAVFLGGVVAYSNRSKVDLLGVDPEVIDRHGAVSGQAAEEMAIGASKRFGADFAVSVTGIAGPGGATSDKPVGTVWLAVAARGSGETEMTVRSFARIYPGSRSAVRERATAAALDALRRAVRGLPLK